MSLNWSKKLGCSVLFMPCTDCWHYAEIQNKFAYPAMIGSGNLKLPISNRPVGLPPQFTNGLFSNRIGPG